MTYTTEQESWILNQIKKERKQLQDDRAALRQSEQLTEGKAYQLKENLNF
ncbi:hypothetical protein IGL46_002051 [Enterococcus sp. DIV1347a]